MQNSKFCIEVQGNDIHETSRPIQPKDSDQFMDINLENAHFGKRKKTGAPEVGLYNIVHKFKVQKLVNDFVKKLRMNSVYREPRSMQNTEIFLKPSNASGLSQNLKILYERQGISLGNAGLALWCLVNIIQITVMVFIFSIIITFPETQKFPIFLYFRIFSIFLYIIDMFLNLTAKRYQNGRHLQKMGQISTYYIKNEFAIDLASILIFPIDVIFTMKTNMQIFIFLLSLFKLTNNIRKLERLQYLFVNSTGKEHYYGLVKVLVTNFAIAHFLSIALNFMAEIDPDNNWRHKLGVDDSEWYVKYIWGYYWGTNIMFTVGFGDLCATNWYEALILVFIEAFSCITLAYNISYVGALISSLRQNEKIKRRKLKIFHRMCQQNLVENEVESKIANFIQEQHRIKQQFQYQAHDEILKGLPVVLQKQYRQQANRTLFSNLGLLSNLLNKGLTSLTEIVQRKVCHPEEIILRRGSVPEFIILQNGRLSMTCRIRSSLDGKQMQSIEVKQKEKPIVLSLDFIKNKSPNYNIKSNTYSVVFSLTLEQLMESLKRSSQISFQTVCTFKDKDASSVYQTETMPCSICKTENHTKFECNRLHYVPLPRHVIFKHIHKQNNAKQSRKKLQRSKKTFSPVLQSNIIKLEQRRYIQDKFDDQHFKEMEDLYKFYTTVHESQLVDSKQFRNSASAYFFQKKNLLKLNGNKTFSQLERLLETRSTHLAEFWEVQCDLAENYNYYFKDSNPDLLKRARKFRRNFYSISQL